jgi:hypothetical protein
MKLFTVDNKGKLIHYKEHSFSHENKESDLDQFGFYANIMEMICMLADFLKGNRLAVNSGICHTSHVPTLRKAANPCSQMEHGTCKNSTLIIDLHKTSICKG